MSKASATKSKSNNQIAFHETKVTLDGRVVEWQGEGVYIIQPSKVWRRVFEMKDLEFHMRNQFQSPERWQSFGMGEEDGKPRYITSKEVGL